MGPKKCRECGKDMLGRNDKKFCSDVCRHSHNNRLRAMNGGNYMNTINAILRKNRSILMDMTSNDNPKVSRNRLADRGFNFNYITSTYTTKKGAVYYYCYDYGYLPVEGEYVFVVKRKE